MANCYNFDDDSLQKFTNEWIRVVKQNYKAKIMEIFLLSIAFPSSFNYAYNAIAAEYCKNQRQNTSNSFYYFFEMNVGTNKLHTVSSWE